MIGMLYLKGSFEIIFKTTADTANLPKLLNGIDFMHKMLESIQKYLYY